MLRYLMWSLRLRRVEYRLAEVPIFLIPVFLTIDDASAFATVPFWEGALIFFFLFAFGDLLNCLADRDLDALYKPHLTEAVLGIGVRGVIAQATLSALFAIALAAHLAWRLDRWILLPGCLFGLFAAYAYSIEPFRLKGRGLWQIGFYWLGLFTGPMIYTALLFTSWPAWDVLAVAFAYGMTQTGVILVNTAEDYPEDRAMNVGTAIVALGLKRGIALALWFTAIGNTGLIAAFALLYWHANISVPAFAALLPLLGASAFVMGSIAQLRRQINWAGDDEAIAAVKASARRVPLWITSVALAALLAAVVAWWAKSPCP
ncbi:MAG TPA: UbiA family prenyltransferase [Gemmataceae bacterium]|nr:UbiA family prenyltransferase [Gemmataceae bacterium]